MNPSWSEVSAAFAALIEIEPQDQASELERIRSVQPKLAHELASLLTAHAQADGFIENKFERILNSMKIELPEFTLDFDLAPGERLLHFEIVELLGQGSIAKVYLAKDLELERLVALKVTRSENREARTLAGFSLDGIIQVYSEHVVDRKNSRLRLLCLQYIAGPTLARLETEIGKDDKNSLIQILEQLSLRNVVLEPEALKWREGLSQLSVSEGLILMTIRLAEILSHAHEHGTFHLDIKPANILIDPYGRPYLSDFNVSTRDETLRKGDLRGLGGTPRYMPPEQVQLFESGLAVATLDGRADVFALGVVLQDLLSKTKFNDSDLQKIIAEATNTSVELRTPSARQLTCELSGWFRCRMAEKDMPKFWRGLRWIQAWPLLSLLLLTLLSQIGASFINVNYNSMAVVSTLSAEQAAVFYKCALAYNFGIFPPLFLVAIIFHWPLCGRDERARRRSLQVPLAIFSLVTLGWLPCAWVFPRAIEYFSSPLPPAVYWQFLGSFSLAWLTSMTTTMAVGIFVLVRALYPKVWRGESRLAAKDLRHCETINRALVAISALVPLLGVLLVLVMAPPEYSASNYQSLKILLIAIVGFGLANLLLIRRLTQLSEAAIDVLKRPHHLVRAGQT